MLALLALRALCVHVVQHLDRHTASGSLGAPRHSVRLVFCTASDAAGAALGADPPGTALLAGFCRHFRLYR